MKKVYTVNKKISLKENMKNVLPDMFDDFTALTDIVVNYPLRKNDLHEMRKSGKPFRYAMEIGEYCFGGEFKKCLDEVKAALELMGEVHDADVMIPEINMHIKEIRLFNQTIPDVKQRLSTRMLRDTVAQLRSSRREMYGMLCGKLNEWKRSNFKGNIIKAVNETDAA
jgi:CHAD domain-containing protein